MTLPWMYSHGARLIVDASFSTDGLPYSYQANLDLRHGQLAQFTDAPQPVMAASEMIKLLADLAEIGDHDAQLARLGWTITAAEDAPAGTLLVRYAAQRGCGDVQISPRDGLWYTLPAAPIWTMHEPPPLARVHLAQARHSALNGSSDSREHPADDAVVDEGCLAACALGELLADLVGKTLATVHQEARRDSLYDIADAFLAGLDDGGLGGAGDVLNPDAFAARTTGYQLTTGNVYIAATMTKTDFDDLNATLSLPPGELGRWKADEHQPITVHLAPNTFSRNGAETFERAIAFVHERNLPYTEYRETAYHPPAAAHPAEPANTAPYTLDAKIADDTPGQPGLSLDRIRDLLHQRGIAATVDGVSSVLHLQIGSTEEDPEWGTRYQLIAGPGDTDSAWSGPRGMPGEFSVADDDDDDGARHPLWTSGDADTEVTAADAIVALLAQYHRPGKHAQLP